MTRYLTTIKTVAALTAAVLALSGTNSHADEWDGGGDGSSFEDPLNWDLDMIPGTAVIGNGDIVTRHVDISIDRTAVRNGSSLNITGGVHSDVLPSSFVRNDLGRGSTGTVNQTGGSYDIGHQLAVGSAANGDGTYKLSGGELIISRGGDSRIDTSLGRRRRCKRRPV